MQNIKSLYTALITPFHPDGSLHEEALRAHLQDQLLNGIEGFVVLGTTGEAPTLTKEEKKRIIKISREEIPKSASLFVGTGSYSTEEAIENTKQAELLGADGALLIAPYYNRPTQEGLFLHFQAISKATSLPLILYNHPGRCGNSLTISTLKRLAELPNIIGVKEITNEISHLNQILFSFREKFPDFQIFAGDDSATYPFLTLGAKAIIAVASNLIPVEMKRLVDTLLAGEFEQARSLHFELMPLFNALNIESNPIPIKAAMNCRGKLAGPCRLPLCDLKPENQMTLEKIVESIALQYQA